MDDAGQPELLPSQLPCLNCGDPTEGNYCRICGQRKVEHRVALRVMLKRALQDQFALTVELPNTLRALFTRPGFLSTEYSAGRIARYVEPLRLYLIASVIVFLLLSLVATRNRQNEERADAAEAEAAAAAADAGNVPSPNATKPMATPQPDTSKATRPSNAAVARCFDQYGPNQMRFCTPSDAINKMIEPRMHELNKLPKGEAGKRVSEFIVARASFVMFMLMPVLAGLLKLVYWRTRKFYAEHFVFALHVHAFEFFVYAIMLIMPRFTGFQYVNTILLTWILVYVLVALKRFYQQSWLITVGKYLLLFAAYMFLFAIAIGVEVLVAIYMV